MHTLDKSIERDARAMLCAVLSFRDLKGEWPVGRDTHRFSVYKTTSDRPAMWEFLEKNDWVRTEPVEGDGKRLKRRYLVTERGRRVVAPPTALPPVVPDRPMPFPDDDVENVIYGYHLAFFYRRGRWPNGAERAAAFKGDRTKYLSRVRRHEAYAKMIRDGTFVKVTFRNSQGDMTYFIMPQYSPEYANKNGWVYYRAPSEAS